MKTLQELTLFDRFLFNETMEIPGMRSFNLLNDTCIIMITPFDLFGKGKYCYTFHPYCEEEPDLRLEDGAVRIFLNSHGTNRDEVSEELVALLEYMETMDADKIGDDSENLKKLHEYVEQIKASEEIGVKYMQKWEELEYEREDAREEGRKVEEISVLRRLLKKKNRDEETVADDLANSMRYSKKIKVTKTVNCQNGKAVEETCQKQQKQLVCRTKQRKKFWRLKNL